MRCSHCGAATDVTSEGVARLAATLERAGARVAAQPMTAADIHASFVEREAVERATRRRTMILAVVFCVVLAAILGVLLLLSSTAH